MSRSFRERLAALATSDVPPAPDVDDLHRRTARRRAKRRLEAGVVAGLVALAIVVPLRSLSNIGGSDSVATGQTEGYIAVTRQTNEGRLNGLGIWLMHPDGTDNHEIPLSVNAIDPAWSPDGQEIAFAGGEERDTEPYNIYLVRSDGSDLQQLTDQPASAVTTHPSWSPDGSQLVFARIEGGHSQLVVLSLQDRAERTIPLPAGFYQAFAPTWSPDGSTIAFVGNRDAHVGVYLVSADGSDLRLVAPLDGVPSLAHPGSPAWSPDGSSLALTSDGDIYVITAADGPLTSVQQAIDVQRLTDAPQLDSAPAFSPDGSQIAFLSGRLQPPPECNFNPEACQQLQEVANSSPRNLDVFIMDADGSDQHIAASGGTFGYSPMSPSPPSWQPSA